MVLLGLLLLMGSSLFGSITIVADGYSSYRDSDFFSVSYDGDSNLGITGVISDLGDDGVFDAGNYGYISASNKTFGGGITADWIYGDSGVCWLLL